MPLRILVADDDPIHRMVLSKMVEKLGHVPTLVSSGEEAVSAIESELADLVLMDIRMPGMGGIRAAQTVAKSVQPHHRPRMIALTADHTSATRAACLEAGMDAYLTKPVDLASLREVLIEGTDGTDSTDSKSAEAVTAGPSHAAATIDIDILQSFRKMMGADDPAFVAEIEADFIQDAAALAHVINRAAQHNDAEAVGRAAHTLKSNGMMFGATRLAAFSRTMEIIADEGLSKPWAPLLDEMIQEIDRIRTALQVRRPLAS